MKNSKKIMSAILTALMVQSILTTGFAVTTSAYETPVNESTAQTQVQESKDGVYGDFEYSVSDGKVTINKYTGSDTEVVIPSEIEGMPVITIRNFAFQSCRNLVHLTIPDSVTSMSANAFFICVNLTDVTVGSGMRKGLGFETFSYCEKLTNINVSNDNITYSSEDGVLFNKDKTEILFYPEGRTDSSYTIPDSVINIGKYSFYSFHSHLTSITMGNNVTDIGDYAFGECNNLKNVTMSDNLKNIGEYSFSFCRNLTNLNMPGSVTNIGYNAFYGCGLTSVVIPESMTKIGCSAFSGCGLINVTIPDSVTNVGENAFSYCNNLISATIGNGMTNLTDYIFSNCSNLTSITIGNSVSDISDYAFSYCSSLTNIDVSNDNDNYSSIDGILFNKNKTEIVRYPAGKTNTNYIIPDSVTSIGDYAFGECNNLTSITIPHSVINIGNYSFTWCENLTDITIPDGVTSMGNNVFSYCRNLVSVNIPEGINSIDDYAFYECSSLMNIIIPNNIEKIGDYAFCGCASLVNIMMPASVREIGRYVFSGCSNLKDVSISDGLTYISDGAFSYCDNLKEITIPKNVKSIGDCSFNWCDNLISINLPISLEYIYPHAFSYCNSLTDIYYAGGVEQWKNVSVIQIYNSWFENAKVHYNCPNVVLDKEELTLEVGQMYTLTATVNPPTETAFTWKSNNTTVATVNGSGRVVARGEGTATITVISSDGKRAYCTVTVSPKKEIVLDKTELNLSVKEQYTLSPSMSPEDTTVTYTFKSNNTAVATVNKAGRIVARGEGTATITVIGSNGLKAYCTVNVTPQKVLVLDKTELNLSVKEQYTLNPSIVPEDTEVTYTFKSDNTTVATVNKAGRIVARGTGTAKITVKSSNGLTAVCNITVE